MESSRHDAWSAARNYDAYMGRWSQQIALLFVDRLAFSPGADWVDVGCGTGALSGAILKRAAPGSLTGIDLSEDFVAAAARANSVPCANFVTGDAADLPLADSCADMSVSALAVNFVPDRQQVLREMRRITRPGGTLAFYVWDYPGGGMGMIDAFWKSAAELDPEAAKLDEANRFPDCTPEGLLSLCAAAGMDEAALEPLQIDTVFPDFEAFWTPFTLGAGPAPGYVASLDQDGRVALKERLHERLSGGGEVRLPARAWAITAPV